MEKAVHIWIPSIVIPVDPPLPIFTTACDFHHVAKTRVWPGFGRRLALLAGSDSSSGTRRRSSSIPSDTHVGEICPKWHQPGHDPDQRAIPWPFVGDQ